MKWAKILNFHPIIFIPISSLALSNQTKSSIRFMKFLILERIKSGWRYGEIISMLESSNCIDCWNDTQRTKSIHSNRTRYFYWNNPTFIDCDIPRNWVFWNNILFQSFLHIIVLKIEFDQIIPVLEPKIWTLFFQDTGARNLRAGLS